MVREMKDSGIECIGEIPADWKIQRFKSVIHSMKKGNGITKEDVVANGKVQCVRYGEIYSKYSGSFAKCVSTTNLVNVSSPQFFSYGDILFACTGELTEEIGKNIVYVGNEECLAGGDIIIANHSQNPIFLNYVMNSAYAQAQKSRDKTKLKVVHISASEIGNVRIALPPIYEQTKVANFLDGECARIDSIIEQTRSSIEEYKKLKQSLITEAVTKGVRPNRMMEDSGIDWVGEIPIDWSVQRIKTIFQLRDERNYLPLEEVNLISLYTDLGVVQHCDLEKTTGNKATNAEGYKKVYENDIIVNIILCWMGAIGRSAYTGVTSPAYDIYIPSDEIDCSFYHYYFRTKGFSGDCYKRGKGIMAMRWRTYSDQFRDIRVVVPPIEEQREIVAHLNKKTAEIDSLILMKEKIVSELEDYKKSLIFEYVTGKREVK